MKAIWVYENTKGLDSFYSRFNTTLFIASVCLWKKYHPSHKTVIYLDTMTYNKFLPLDIFYLWDEVKPLEYNERINRDQLWSGCKSKIVSQATEPFVIIDHDFLIFKNIDEHLDDSIIYSYDEDMSSWYINPWDEHNKRLTNPIEFHQNQAANVSLLYIPDPAFAQRYGQRVIQNHTEFTQLVGKNIHSGYLTISEQYMLKDWLVKENIKHKTLSKNIFCCKSVEYSQDLNDIGIWDLEETKKYYFHYGVNKRNVLDNHPKFGYDETIQYLYRCINASKLINIEYLNDKLTRFIYNR